MIVVFEIKWTTKNILNRICYTPIIDLNNCKVSIKFLRQEKKRAKHFYLLKSLFQSANIWLQSIIGRIHKWCPNFWVFFWPPPSPLSEFYLLTLYYKSQNFMESFPPSKFGHNTELLGTDTLGGDGTLKWVLIDAAWLCLA